MMLIKVGILIPLLLLIIWRVVRKWGWINQQLRTIRVELRFRVWMFWLKRFIFISTKLRKHKFPIMPSKERRYPR